MKKFYQVEPEATYFDEEMFNELLERSDCTIIGNRYCRGKETENYKKVYKMLENIDNPDDIQNGYSYYNNFMDAINDYLPPLNKNNYSDKEMHRLKELVKNYPCGNYGNYIEIAAEVLSIYTGKKYVTGILRGCCQGDRAEVIYKKETDEKTIEWIEALLFGTYTEYITKDEGETVCGYYVLDTENPVEKLREYEGDGDEIEIYNINGYISTPKYEKISDI